MASSSARAKPGAVEIHIHDLRDWTHDRHQTVDDRPFGGGEGMLLKPEPYFWRWSRSGRRTRSDRKVILLSAQGRQFDQEKADELTCAYRAALDLRPV